MRRTTPLRAAALLVLLSAGCASVKNEAAVGTVLTPGNTQIPMPPGQWTLLASKKIAAGSFANGGPSNQHSVQVVYARLEAGAIRSVAIVTTSADSPAPGGYTTGAGCLAATTSDFVYYQDVRDRYVNDVDCTKVTGGRGFNAPGAASSDLYRDAYAQAQTYGGFPRAAIQVNFSQARSERYMEYFIYFFPETRIDWRMSRMAPASKKYVDDIVAWAKGFRNAVRLGTEYAL